MFSCAEISDGQLMGCGGVQMRGWHIKIAVAVLGLTLRHYVAEFHVESTQLITAIIKAFDKVHYGMLFKILLDKKLPLCIISLLLDNYFRQQARVLWINCNLK